MFRRTTIGQIGIETGYCSYKTPVYTYIKNLFNLLLKRLEKLANYSSRPVYIGWNRLLLFNCLVILKDTDKLLFLELALKFPA